MTLSCSKKKILALLRGKTSKHQGDFCLSCPHSFPTEKKT